MLTEQDIATCFAFAKTQVTKNQIPTDFFDVISQPNIGNVMQDHSEFLIATVKEDFPDIEDYREPVRASYETVICMRYFYCYRNSIRDAGGDLSQIPQRNLDFYLQFPFVVSQVDSCICFNDLNWHDYFHSRFEKSSVLISKFSDEELAAALKYAISMIHIYEAVQAVKSGNYELAFDRIASSIFASSSADHNTSNYLGRDLKSERHRELAKLKAEKSPAGQVKKEIKIFWEDWQANDPTRYRSRAEFALDMVYKFEDIKSPRTIENWCKNEWEQQKKEI